MILSHDNESRDEMKDFVRYCPFHLQGISLFWNYFIWCWMNFDIKLGFSISHERDSSLYIISTICFRGAVKLVIWGSTFRFLVSNKIAIVARFISAARRVARLEALCPILREGLAISEKVPDKPYETLLEF